MQAHNPHQHSGGECRGGATSLRPAWSTYDTPGQPGLQSNTLSQTKRQEKQRLFFCAGTDRQNWKTQTHYDNHYHPKRREGPLTQSDANGGGTGARGSLSITEFKMAHSSPFSTVKCT